MIHPDGLGEVNLFLRHALIHPPVLESHQHKQSATERGHFQVHQKVTMMEQSRLIYKEVIHHIIMYVHHLMEILLMIPFQMLHQIHLEVYHLILGHFQSQTHRVVVDFQLML